MTEIILATIYAVIALTWGIAGYRSERYPTWPDVFLAIVVGLLWPITLPLVAAR